MCEGFAVISPSVSNFETGSLCHKVMCFRPKGMEPTLGSAVCQNNKIISDVESQASKTVSNLNT